MGWRIHAHAEEQKAIEQVLSELEVSWDVLLLQWSMPGATDIIRHTISNAQAVLVLVDHEEEEVQALSIGATDAMKWPSVPALLRERVKRTKPSNETSIPIKKPPLRKRRTLRDKAAKRATQEFSGALGLADEAVAYAQMMLNQMGELTTIKGELWAGKTPLKNNTFVVDAVQGGLGFGCTIFHGNVRIATTAIAAGGSDRALGTQANELITQQVYRRGEPFKGITRTIGKDWVIVYVPLRDHQGRIVGMLAAFRELMNFLYDLTSLDDAPEGLLLHDLTGHIRSVNRTVCDMLGVSKQEVLGQSMLDFTVKGIPIERELAWKETLQEPMRFEHTWQRADGHQFVVELTVNLVDTTEGKVLMTIARDFTRQYKAREKLRTLNGQLIQVNKFLEQSINQLKVEQKRARDAEEKALRMSEAKSVFLANMSHELRTPLNAIIGYSELLLEEAEESQNEGSTRDLKRIHTAGAHLLVLLNTLLDLGKIEAGHVELLIETFDFNELLEDIKESMQPAIQKKNNKLILEIAEGVGKVTSDKTKLRQCIYNLLSNAAKFTSDGLITMRAHRTEGNICLIVEDTGIGMTPEQLEKIFDEFKQADASIARDYGGTGLGLSLVKSLSKLLGGGIQAISETGFGTTFTLHFKDAPEVSTNTSP